MTSKLEIQVGFSLYFTITSKVLNFEKYNIERKVICYNLIDKNSRLFNKNASTYVPNVSLFCFHNVSKQDIFVNRFHFAARTSIMRNIGQ